MLRMAAFALFIALLSTAPASAQRGGPANVFADPVIEREFSRDIEALGTLEPNEQVDLSLNASDRITALYFDDGERVRQGKTLLSLAQGNSWLWLNQPKRMLRKRHVSWSVLFDWLKLRPSLSLNSIARSETLMRRKPIYGRCNRVRRTGFSSRRLTEYWAFGA